MRLLLPLTLSLTVGTAYADVVELRSGGQVEGAVKRVEQERASFVIVEVDAKVKIAIPESQVARVAESADLEEYRQRVKATKEDANEHYELARWCKGKQLHAQSKYHYQRAISIDPEHKESRGALGYIEHDGKWIRTTELRKIRGMISVAGRDRLPEEVALRDARDEADLSVKLWNREVAKLRAAVLRGGDKAAEATATLVNINDPNVAWAMANELLSFSNQPTTMRLFWIERLSFFANRPAMEALVKTGLYDPDAVVQEKALEALQKISPENAIANYVPLLKSNDNVTVRRAAKALAYFPDPELALALVDALVTEHKSVTQSGAGLSPSFGSDGSGGMSAGGGKPVVRTDRVENPPVLSLLREIEPNADFGYSQARWREHFAAQLSSYSGNMRRDP